MGFLDSIGDFLFGEEPSQEITQQSKLSPEQQRLLASIEPLLQGQIGRAQSGESPATRLQETSLEGLEEVARNVLASDGNIQKGRRELGGILDREDTDFDDFFKRNISDPLRQEFEDVLDGSRKKFAGGGNVFSGEHAAAARDITDDFATNLARQRSATAVDFRRQDTADKLNALQLLPGVEGFEANLLSQTAGVGGNAANQEINQVLAALGLDTTENIVFNNPGSPGLIPSFFGGSGGKSVGQGIANLVF